MSTIHFLNVGHGDCTVIEHDSGNVTVIDCNNCGNVDETSAGEILKDLGGGLKAFVYEVLRFAGFSRDFSLKELGYSVPLTDPIEFLRKNLGVESIYRYVQTHPDLDHMRGISKLAKMFDIGHFWDTEHDKKVEKFGRTSDRADWATYQKLRGGTNVLRFYRSVSQPASNVKTGDGLYVYAPTRDLAKTANGREDWNELSYVLALREHERTIILGGDAGEATWSDTHRAIGSNLKCDILKASHHGRESGFHELAVSAMKPALTVVSVGRKPDTDASDQYRKYSQHVWSTRWKGDISVRIEANGLMVASSRCGSQKLTWQVSAAKRTAATAAL